MLSATFKRNHFVFKYLVDSFYTLEKSFINVQAYDRNLQLFYKSEFILPVSKFLPPTILAAQLKKAKLVFRYPLEWGSRIHYSSNALPWTESEGYLNDIVEICHVYLLAHCEDSVSNSQQPV